MKKMKKITVLLFAMFFCANMQLSHVHAGSTEYVTMREGDSVTLRLNSSEPGTKGSWVSMDPSTVVIQSQNYVSCTVKAVKETPNRPVIIRCDYTYIQGVGKYSYIRRDYKDFYVTVTDSGLNGTNGSGSYTLSASPGTMYLDLSGEPKELTLTAGKTLSPELYIRAASSGKCVSVGRLNETEGSRQKFIIFPTAVGRQTIQFELREQIRKGYEVIKKRINVNFVVTCSHVYGQGTVTKAPSAGQPVVKTYICKYCKATRTEQIAFEGRDIASCKITINSGGLIYDGSAKTPSVDLEYQGTKLVQNTDYLLSYSNNTNAGTGVVKITGKGSYIGQAERVFTIGKAGQNLSCTITADHITVGQAAKITASASGTISYQSSNSQIAFVDSNGVIMGKKAGKTDITVTAEATDNYKATSKTYTVTVGETLPSAEEPGTSDINKRPFLAASVSSMSLEKGQKQEISISVQPAYHSGLSLTAKPFSPNIYAEWTGGWNGSRHSLRISGYAAGKTGLEVQLIDTGSNAVLDTVFIDITVSEKTNTIADTIDISTCSINCRTASYIYNGRARTPYVMISCGHNILRKDRDYTLEYINNVNAGTAKIRISGKGNYSGTVTRTFTIDKARQTLRCLPHRCYTRPGTDKLLITVTNARGKVSYESSDSRYITVSDGVACIQQDTPAGTYKITVTASGDENYRPASETITIFVR